MNDQLVKDFIEKYFNQALKSFLDYQQQVEEQIRRTHGLPTVFPSVSAWTKAMLQPFASAFDARSPEPPPPPAQERDLREIIKDLQNQVAELKQNKGPRKAHTSSRTR
jgi:hypothetical protein